MGHLPMCEMSFSVSIFWRQLRLCTWKYRKELVAKVALSTHDACFPSDVLNWGGCPVRAHASHMPFVQWWRPLVVNGSVRMYSTSSVRGCGELQCPLHTIFLLTPDIWLLMLRVTLETMCWDHRVFITPKGKLAPSVNPLGSTSSLYDSPLVLP